MGGRGRAGWSGVKGWKWDNCNSIINKYILKFFKRKTIKKWDYIELKTSAQQKKLLTQLKGNSLNWENIFANDTSDKGLICKIY